MRHISETVKWVQYSSDGVEDSQGNTSAGYLDPVDLGIYAFNPGVTVEPLLPGHDRVITTPTLYIPSSPRPKPRDRIIVRGEPFEVEGVTLAFHNPYDASMDGCEISLKQVTG